MQQNNDLYDLLMSSKREPLVMAIINATPDSFCVHSASIDEQLRAVELAVSEGCNILDIGGCSTRPQSEPVSQEEEWQRIEPLLKQLQKNYSSMPLSVDTFRAEVARRAVEYYGVQIINDISGGAEEEIFQVAAKNKATYILTFNKPIEANVTNECLQWFENKVTELKQLGVDNIILDQGFGFQKDYEQNWQLFNDIDKFAYLGYPLLVGISNKRMLQAAVNQPAQNAQNATTAAHFVALQKGAAILRVHDVRAAKEVIEIYELTKSVK